MVTIRALDEDDWERLREVRLAALRESPDVFGSSLAREEGFREPHWRMRLRGSPWWLASRGQDDVGLVSLIQEPGAPADQRHVVALWVAPGARRLGVASALVEAVVQHAADDGAAGVTLWLVEDNDTAAALYRAHGFVPTGERMALVRDPSRLEERWRRELTGSLQA
ncbi:GNAT family N-acetyltransferase [Cellulomonas sp. APG4]|uniref:GNAT family N-acetyltransferase n=1 Tax=Cellulomonas sp. APG4 TaxID=1538656 RepID=UPI00137A5101|nr:GNAT family N-acetyltransferase [Cellulomonas sp. APG4]